MLPDATPFLEEFCVPWLHPPCMNVFSSVIRFPLPQSHAQWMRVANPEKKPIKQWHTDNQARNKRLAELEHTAKVRKSQGVCRGSVCKGGAQVSPAKQRIEQWHTIRRATSDSPSWSTPTWCEKACSIW